MFFVVKKNQIILLFLLIVTLLLAFFFSLTEKDKDAALCKKFLNEFGYSFNKKPYEKAKIHIPEGFGKVYESYNLIQKEAGFDLTPLRGKTVTRYTFRLEGEDYTYANILICDGIIHGGDLIDPSISGKIAPLIPKEKE